jgi:peptidoglycan/xylan/chitin deacetylase (PgdA/CDA1 family)
MNRLGQSVRRVRGNPNLQRWNWRILCYHTVDPGQAATFAAQLRWFRRRGLRFQSFSRAFVERNQNRWHTWMTVSFDDGDWSTCAVAQKVLDDEGIKAILYLTTDYILQGRTYQATDVRPAATWDQLGRWIDAGHEIGGHTHTHLNLTQSGIDRLVEELDKSRAIIRRELGCAPVHFSYPWGQYNDEVLRWFGCQMDWRSAVTVNGQGNYRYTDPFQLGRNVMTADWDEARMRESVRSLGARVLRRVRRAVTDRLCHAFRT